MKARRRAERVPLGLRPPIVPALPDLGEHILHGLRCADIAEETFDGTDSAMLLFFRPCVLRGGYKKMLL